MDLLKVVIASQNGSMLQKDTVRLFIKGLNLDLSLGQLLDLLFNSVLPFSKVPFLEHIEVLF